MKIVADESRLSNKISLVLQSMVIISFDGVIFVEAGIGEGEVHLLENDEIAELAPMMGLRLKIKAFRDKIKVS